MKTESVDLSPYRCWRLCPRACGVDRVNGETGFCGETARCRVALAEPHFGEEPSFSGTRGSGTIFFTGCSCRCFFCQNHQISMGGLGCPTDPDALFRTAQTLVAAGVHNLNLVTPDHVWPHIEALVRQLRAVGITIPILHNGSGYHTVESVLHAASYVDIFLPDFKAADPNLAHAVMGDRRYPEIAVRALDAMIETCGFLDPWDPTGQQPARQGVLVRHLVLPGETSNSLAVLDLLRQRYGRFLPISILRQFRPTPRCRPFNRFLRAVSATEYAEIRTRVEELGFEHVYLQEAPDPAAPFLPDFRQKNPFAGNREGPRCR